jgi:hypothetical protein
MADSEKVMRTRKEAAASNLEAARLIVADAQRYGPESLMGQWARLWLTGLETETIQDVLDAPGEGNHRKPASDATAGLEMPNTGAA